MQPNKPKPFNFSEIATSTPPPKPIQNDAKRIRKQIQQLITQDWKEQCVEEWRTHVQSSSLSLENYVQCITSIWDMRSKSKDDSMLLGMIGQCEAHHRQLQSSLLKFNNIYSKMKQIIHQCKLLCNSLPYGSITADSQFDEWSTIQILEKWCDMYNLELQSKELIFIGLLEDISSLKELQTLQMYLSSWKYEPYISNSQIQQWQSLLQWDNNNK